MFLEITVHTEIVGDIPELGIAITASPEVIVHTMKHLMPKQEFDLFGFQHFDETGIVIEVATICGGSGTPFIGIDQFQPGSQVAKETGPEQQTHTGSDQFFTHHAIQFGIGRAQEISELFGVVFVLGISGSCSCHGFS
jgi:hypothetical protein